MIQFNELRITPDSQYLIIEAQVKEDSYFDNVGITEVLITKIKNAEGEFVELLKEDSFEESVAVEIHKESDAIKKVRYVLSKNLLNDVSLSNSYIEVTIVTDGENTSMSPIGYANYIVKASVVDLYPFYVKTLHNIRMLNSLCTNSNELVDCILKFKALELAFKTGNVSLAKQYWFKYFDSLNNESGRAFINKNCYE